MKQNMYWKIQYLLNSLCMTPFKKLKCHLVSIFVLSVHSKIELLESSCMFDGILFETIRYAEIGSETHSYLMRYY